jgi:hypothetical protein
MMVRLLIVIAFVRCVRVLVSFVGFVAVSLLGWVMISVLVVGCWGVVVGFVWQ